MGVFDRYGSSTVLLGAVLLFALARGSFGLDYSLDGEWKFRIVPPGAGAEQEDARAAEYSRKDLADSDWEPIVVPGYWDQPPGGWPWSSPVHRGGPHPEHDGEAWYRSRFTIPENRFPQQEGTESFHAVLRFQGVAAQTSVWLNGTFVGRHLGAFAPFELNVTEALLKDEPNVLSIRVRDKTGFHSGNREQAASLSSKIPLGFDPDCGGIHGSVSIRITPPERILDLAVFSDTRSATVEAAVSPEAVGNGTLTLEVTDPGGKRIAAFGGVTTAVIPLNSPIVRVNLRDIPEADTPKSWSPESPNRYRITAKLTNAQGGVDVAETGFGFRSFEIGDGGFFLNGAPYFLLGAGSPPHYEKPSEAVMRGHLSELKAAGVRMVRFAHEPPGPKWLDLCDELGLLAWVEGPLSAEGGAYDLSNAELVAAASRELQALVRSLRNHPSVAIWTVGSGNARAIAEVGRRGETGQVLSRLAKAMAPIDPDCIVLPESESRRLIESPVADWSSGLGWYHGREGDWGPFLLRTASREQGATTPWVCSALETGTSSAAQGRLIPDPIEEAAARMRIGFSGEDRNRLLFAQSKRIKRLIEMTRAERNPETNWIAGIFPFSSANWFFHPLLEGKMRPKPLLASIREAYAPVILSIDIPKRNFFAGELLQTTVTVVNDLPDGRTLKGGNLILEAFVGADELNTQTQLGNLEVKSTSSVPFAMSVGLSANTQGLRRTTIRARLFSGEEEIAMNQTEILVASPNWSRPNLEAESAGLLVYDPKGSLSPFLDKYKIDPRPFNHFDQLSNAVGLVIGAGGFDDHVQRGWPVIEKWLEAGGKVAVAGLVPGQDRWSFSGPYPPGYRAVSPPGWPTGIDRVNVAIQGHPLFEGVHLDALEEWGSNQVVAEYTLAAEAMTPRSGHLTLVHAAVQSGSLEWGKVVVEERFREGSLLYSQLDLTAKALEDPIASKILSNLFEWAANSLSPVVYDPKTPAIGFLDPVLGGARSQVTAEFGGTGENDPIRALHVADGPFEATSCCGVDVETKIGVRPLPHKFGPEKRVYYDLDDRFWHDATARAEIKVLVNCLSPTKLRLDYDSDDPSVEHLGHYKQSKVVDVLEVGIWKEVVFSAPQARFANRQRNGADFRLTTVSGEAIYGPISVRRVE